ncbi:MAG: homoserine dehydrogenase, partial [Gammaproteobacteria bacterium]|nr:homoserine dehydrogenase [Gammaproteobacteria bacterium]
ASKEAGVSIYFESSVCAGTPIIKLLKTDLAANRISKISGMLNGTTNFILSQMETGNTYEAALKDAQKLGYAEADPKLDVGGIDAAHKIGILASLAFNCTLPLKNFYIEGIESIHQEDFLFAKEQGYTIKHLAVAEENKSGEILVRSHPVMLPINSNLGSLKGVRNGDATPVAMSLDLTAKDLELITSFARDRGVSATVADAVLDQVRDACDGGWGSRDMADLVRFLSSKRALPQGSRVQPDLRGK